MYTPNLPGKARAALFVVGAYLALSVYGIVQVLEIREHLSRRNKSAVDLVVWLTIGVVALFVIFGAMIAKKYTATPMIVLTSISTALSMFTLRSGLTVSWLVSFGMLVAILSLLGSRDVREYFSARRYERSGYSRPALIDA